MKYHIDEPRDQRWEHYFDVTLRAHGHDRSQFTWETLEPNEQGWPPVRVTRKGWPPKIYPTGLSDDWLAALDADFEKEAFGRP